MNIIRRLFPVKIYSIGRAPENDIVESNNMISRYHAVLKVYPLGKCTITDNSCNGTTVNGKRLQNSKETEIKRGDNIVFANEADLDWSRIDKANGRLAIILLSIILAAIIVFVVFVIMSSFSKEKNLASDTIAPIEQTTVQKKKKNNQNKEVTKKNATAEDPRYSNNVQETESETNKKIDSREDRALIDDYQSYTARKRAARTANKINNSESSKNKSSSTDEKNKNIKSEGVVKTKPTEQKQNSSENKEGDKTSKNDYKKY